VLPDRAEELLPQRVAGARRDHARGRGGAGQHGTGPGRHGARPADGEHREQDRGGDDGVEQQFLGEEDLGRREQAKPGAAPGGTPPAREAAPRRQPQDGVGDQRRQHRELQVVVALRGLDQGRRESVDQPAGGGRGRARGPAAEHGEHGQRGPGEAERHQHRQAGLRPGQQRQRCEQHAGQQHRRVPHQVDALRRVHPRGYEGGQPQVRGGRRVVPEVPCELVAVVGIGGDDAGRGVPPQPHSHDDRRDQVIQCR
jgi:hypothetical protein